MECFAGQNRGALLTLASAGAGAALVTCVSRPSETGEAAGALSEEGRISRSGIGGRRWRSAPGRPDGNTKLGNGSQRTIAAWQDALDFVRQNEHWTMRYDLREGA